MLFTDQAIAGAVAEGDAHVQAYGQFLDATVDRENKRGHACRAGTIPTTHPGIPAN